MVNPSRRRDGVNGVYAWREERRDTGVERQVEYGTELKVALAIGFPPAESERAGTRRSVTHLVGRIYVSKLATEGSPVDKSKSKVDVSTIFVVSAAVKTVTDAVKTVCMHNVQLAKMSKPQL